MKYIQCTAAVDASEEWPKPIVKSGKAIGVYMGPLVGPTLLIWYKDVAAIDCHIEALQVARREALSLLAAGVETPT